MPPTAREQESNAETNKRHRLRPILSLHVTKRQREGQWCLTWQATPATPDIVTAHRQPPRSGQWHRATTTARPRYLLDRTVDSKIGSEQTIPKNKESQRSHGEIHHPHAIGHGRRKADRTHWQDPWATNLQYPMELTTPDRRCPTKSRKRLVLARWPQQLHMI